MLLEETKRSSPMVLNISLLKNQNLIQLGFFLQYFFFRAKVFALAQTYAAAATFLCRALALQFLHAHGGRRRGTATGDEQQQAFFMEQGALRGVFRGLLPVPHLQHGLRPLLQRPLDVALPRCA
jgi:hypothetical protein